MTPPPSTPAADCEYIVVGSGAGGGTIAARLAEAGRRVIVLEAGGDPRALKGGGPVQPGANRLPADYDVPAFHAFASENEAMSWAFFVRHYADDARQRRDRKFVERFGDARVDGIYYPRAGALGGCTSHNAMILVYPHNEDWDYIARLTGDTSWSAATMRTYFERIENCRHRPFYRWLAKLGINPTRHGWRGWLPTEVPLPVEALHDRTLVRVIKDSAREAFLADGRQIDRTRWFLQAGLDPNDWRLVEDDAVGVRWLPLSTDAHVRTGTRERLLDVARRYPDRLTVLTHALVTRVILDADHRATGVEFLEGERLYRAHTSPGGGTGTPRALHASREVILAGGAFNSPQLLMLSGIGDPAVLHRHGIETRVPLPGVGTNLQDRYEVGVVNRLNRGAWEVDFDPTSPQAATPRGIYASNGSVLAVFRRSAADVPLPDLFCMALLAPFEGYYPGYSKAFAKGLNALTWVVLKAHTNNRGTVTLRSPDPRDTPLIDFNYFSDGGLADLNAVVEGMQFVRRMTAGLRKRGIVAEEEVPGESVASPDDLAQFVRDNTWGHHACGTCPIGPRDANGVLDSAFRVHGTKNLRVVDASVFPRIPGFFIVSAIYMIGEKAADVVLADRAR